MAAGDNRRVLCPDISFLKNCEKLLLTTADMAMFLQIPKQAMQEIANTGRVPMPHHLGFGQVVRWNVLELLAWVEAGCPRRGDWIRICETTRVRTAHCWR